MNAIPILLLLDYAAAFASVAHEWIFMVLKSIKLPRGWFNLVRCLYDDNDAFSESPSGFV